jgi:hypothetical protein
MRALPTIAAVLAAVALASCTPGTPATKDYAYPAWGFKASFQAPPLVTSDPGTADGSKPPSTTVGVNSGGRDFAVWAADVSKADLSIDDLTSSASDHVSKELGFTPSIPAYAATSEGVEGRELSFTKDGRWQATMRVFVSGGRA